MVDEQLISIRRDSIVSKLDLGNGEYQIAKTYCPERYSQYQDIFGVADTFRIGHERDTQRSLFFNEAYILKALSNLEELMVPKVLRIDEETLTIYMEHVPYPTFQDNFRVESSNGNINHQTKQLVTEILPAFKNSCAKNLTNIYQATAKKGKPILRKHKEEEENYRLRNYLQAILYNRSQDLTEYWEDQGINLDDLNPKQIRASINSFLNSRDMVLNTWIRNFVRRDRQLCETVSGVSDNCNSDKIIFSTGDYGPHNVFLTPPESGLVRIIDFDKARLGNHYIDLVSGIYHIHRFSFDPKQEAYSWNLAKEYFEKVGFTSPLQRMEKLVGLLSARLRQSIRLFAVYCQMNDYEIRKFIGGIVNQNPVYSALNNGDLKNRFLDDVFGNYFREFLNYYRYRDGEGWESVLEPLPASLKEKKKLTRKQLEAVEQIFKDSGVIMGKIISQKRSTKLKRILTHDE